MYQFDYHKATSVQEAAGRLAEDEDRLLLAGGMTLIPTMKQRLAMPTEVIDLNGVAEIKGICPEGEGLTIGAMTTHATVAASADVQSMIPSLAALASHIGDPSVRNRGTMGGSVANADPSADYPAAVVGLGATIRTDRRQIAADEFFTDLFETALEPGEIITAIHFPKPERAAYAKFDNPASRYAIVGVFVAQTTGGVRVAVTGAAGSVFRVEAMEAALADRFDPAALDGIAIAADGLNSDIHASPEYRAHLVSVMAKRAVKKALAG